MIDVLNGVADATDRGHRFVNVLLSRIDLLLNGLRRLSGLLGEFFDGVSNHRKAFASIARVSSFDRGTQ